eukprot:9498254-Pyramimonas_sp.AAC.2
MTPKASKRTPRPLREPKRAPREHQEGHRTQHGTRAPRWHQEASTTHSEQTICKYVDGRLPSPSSSSVSSSRPSSHVSRIHPNPHPQPLPISFLLLLPLLHVLIIHVFIAPPASTCARARNGVQRAQGGHVGDKTDAATSLIKATRLAIVFGWAGVDIYSKREEL